MISSALRYVCTIFSIKPRRNPPFQLPGGLVLCLSRFDMLSARTKPDGRLLEQIRFGLRVGNDVSSPLLLVSLVSNYSLPLPATTHQTAQMETASRILPQW